MVAIDTTQKPQGVEDKTTQQHEGDSQNQNLMTPRATPGGDSTSYDAVDSQYEETLILENNAAQNETIDQPRSIRNIGLNLNEANILTGRRVRRRQRHAYAVRR
jgi:hypothetical protein